jgi:DNA invertase Pin-like site-specific DNA recombinase
VVCWRLDRLGRNLKHLITLLEEFQALGVAFVSLAEGIDATTPAGKLQMHILGAIAEFERARIVERVRAGTARRVHAAALEPARVSPSGYRPPAGVLPEPPQGRAARPGRLPRWPRRPRP